MCCEYTRLSNLKVASLLITYLCSCLHNDWTSLSALWDQAECLRVLGGGVIRLIVGFQPLMVISPTASWIRQCTHVCRCMRVSWYGPVLFGPHDLRPTVLGAKPPIQFRHRWAGRNHSDHLYWLRAASRLPNSLMPSAKPRSETSQFYVFGVSRSGIEPRPPAPRADALTTVLCRDGR